MKEIEWRSADELIHVWIEKTKESKLYLRTRK
jgi:hypothetical protein